MSALILLLQLFYDIFFLIYAAYVVEEQYGLNACQLECPPYHHFHGEQCVAYKRQRTSQNHCHKRYAAEQQVGARNVYRAFAQHASLPYSEKQYNGREYEVYGVVRNKHYAECYHYKCHKQERCILLGAFLYLVAIEAEKQR